MYFSPCVNVKGAEKNLVKVPYESIRYIAETSKVTLREQEGGHNCSSNGLMPDDERLLKDPDRYDRHISIVRDQKLFLTGTGVIFVNKQNTL
jgi:hypothetical protein